MKRGIITAGHRKTAEAGAEILRSGGNAFDAAIAAMFAASIAEPALASLGGGGFLMAHQQDETPVLYDFFVQTPRKHKSRDEIEAESFICDFGSAQQEFVIGIGTSAVPGYVKGVFEVARNYSTIPITELIQPALDLVKEGIVVNEMQAHVFQILTPIYLTDTAKEIYESRRNPGHTIQSGEVTTFPNLADLLQTLAIEGDDLFYRGEIASAINSTAQQGGQVSYDDLINYQVELRHPIRSQYGDYSAFLNPTPSSGGILIALNCSRLNKLYSNTWDFGDRDHLTELLNTLTESNSLGESDSANHGDFDPELISIYRQISAKHPLAPKGTTHISVIDEKQNSVSVSVSNGEGCGTFIPGTEVMMNNMMGEHDVNPSGLTDWPANTRLSSMMAPTIALSSHGEIITTGSGGSNRIPTAITQVLMNLIEFGMPVEKAVRSPRMHYHKGELYYEDLFESSALAEVVDTYENCKRFDRRDLFFGGVHTAKFDGRNFEGYGDNRRDGVAISI